MEPLCGLCQGIGLEGNGPFAEFPGYEFRRGGCEFLLREDLDGCLVSHNPLSFPLFAI